MRAIHLSGLSVALAVGAIGLLIVSSEGAGDNMTTIRGLSFGFIVALIVASLALERAIARSLGRHVFGFLATGVVHPGAAILLLALLVWWRSSVSIEHMLLAYCVSGIAAILLAYATSTLRFVPRASTDGVSRLIDARQGLPHSKDAIRVGIVMTFGTASALIMSQSDVWVLSAYVSNELVGTYWASLRIASLVSFLLVVGITVAGPRFSAAAAAGDTRRLEADASMVAALTFWPALLVFAVVVFFPAHLLSFFGPAFEGTAPALRVLAIGHVIATLAGPLQPLLNLTGNHAVVARSLGAMAVLNVLLNFALIPSMGLMGAALSSAICMTGWNVVLAWKTYETHGFFVSPYRGLQYLWSGRGGDLSSSC